jgi:hypothetical protein
MIVDRLLPLTITLSLGRTEASVQRERELADQVFAAWEAWNQAELEFNALNADTVNQSSVMHWPDRLEAIRNAALTQHRALAEYAHSLKEYREYLTHVEVE